MVKKVAIVCAGKNMKYFGIFGALKPCGFSAYGCRAKACCALADGSGNKDFDRSLRWVK
jgi:hypothetical protein